MTTCIYATNLDVEVVVEAYRLDRYDNTQTMQSSVGITVVEAYRLDRYDNFVDVVAL